MGMAPIKSIMGAQAKPSNLTEMTLVEASALVRERKVSPVDLTRACLARIERLNPSLNCFITVTADSALMQAKEAENEIQRRRWRGPLHGIPIALKDLFDTSGVRTTAASGLVKDRVPTEDAEAVRKLKAAGAVLLGKTNMTEFAYSGNSAVTYFGAVNNPWNLAYITGASSSGSGAAVAARLCFGALGSDTGGSVRSPAAGCGIVGLKPTYGLVSNRGVLPLSWSLDHVGPMTRTVLDNAVMLQAIAGYDPAEPTSMRMPIPDYQSSLSRKASAIRVGSSARVLFR
jgi:aspartyl-tRNA(Asn)/glutamyl-tRNA(Gln) amidotransferase subunit A